MRTVSFIGPDDGRSGAGMTDAANGTCGEKFDAADVDPARRFCSDFDYSDLDLPFLKLWIIPLLLNSMSPILTVK